jgi:WXG100 family type VII secretion target
MSDIIQIHYDELEDIRKLFADLEADVQKTRQAIVANIQELIPNGWEGEQASAFNIEMENDILPGFDRLSTALTRGAEALQRVAQVFTHAEEQVRGGSGVGAGGMEIPTNIPPPAGGFSFMAANLVEGEIEVEGIAVPDGEHSTGHVNDWANHILNNPKDANRIFESNFGDPKAIELMRQMAGWAENAQSDPRAGQAYAAALEMHKELFNTYDETMKRRFINNIANMEGPGAGRLKADTVDFLLGKFDGKPNVATKLEYARGLAHILNGSDSGKMLEYMVTNPQHERNVRKLFATTMENFPGYGKLAVGNALGNAAVEIARQTASADPESANKMANRLGRIVANAETSLYDLQQYNKSSGGPSTEHGAAILRSSMSAVDTLTGGVSSPVTSVLKKGVDMLEAYELKNAPKGAPDPRIVLRKGLSDLVTQAYYTQIDPKGTKGGSARVQDQVETFRTNVFKGREETWREMEILRQTPLEGI